MDIDKIKDEISKTSKQKQQFGVGNQSESIPLVGVAAKVDIVDWSVQVQLNQLFQNVEEYPIEAIYTFPVDESAAICGFEAFIDNKRIIGKVQTKEKAFQTYDDAISKGKGAYLLEKSDKAPNMFQLSVGNLPPKKHVLIRIIYVTELTLDGGYLRFALPMTTSQVKNSIKIIPAYNIQIGLSLEMDIKMATPILDLVCPTHSLAKINITKENAQINFSDNRGLSCDFVTFVKVNHSNIPKVLVEYDSSSRTYAAMISFMPELKPTQKFNPNDYEIVFIIDRSGSMDGKNIEDARRTLQICLRGFPEGTFFNIYSFGDFYEKLYKKSVKLNDSSVRVASNYVASLYANMGGTVLLPALKDLYSYGTSKSKRDIFIFTDGQLGDKEEVIKLAKKNKKNQRIFVFAIGNGVEEQYCRELTEATEGNVEFVNNREVQMTSVVTKQIRRATGAFISDINLEWSGIRNVEFSPKGIPNLFQGGSFTAFGIFSEFSEENEKAISTLKGTFESKSISFAMEFSKNSTIPGVMIHRLAAHKVIKDLENQIKSNRDVKSKIEYLGTTYNIASSQTSFVGVEDRENPIMESMVTKNITLPTTTTPSPQLRNDKIDRINYQLDEVKENMLQNLSQVLERGEMLDIIEDKSADLVMHSKHFYKASRSLRRRRFLKELLICLIVLHPLGFIGFFIVLGIFVLFKLKDKIPKKKVVYSDYTKNVNHKITSSMDKLDALLLLMKADGSWDIGEDLSTVTGIPVQKIKENIPENFSGWNSDKLWGTCLALGCIENNYPNLKEDLKLVFSKSYQFLSSKNSNIKPAIAVELGRQFLKFNKF